MVLLESKRFLQKVYGTLESDKSLDDLRGTLRKNFKITFILEGLSLKLWCGGAKCQRKALRDELNPTKFHFSTA